MLACFARSGSQSHPPPLKILDPPMYRPFRLYASQFTAEKYSYTHWPCSLVVYGGSYYGQLVHQVWRSCPYPFVSTFPPAGYFAATLTRVLGACKALFAARKLNWPELVDPSVDWSGASRHVDLVHTDRLQTPRTRSHSSQIPVRAIWTFLCVHNSSSVSLA